MSTEHQRYSTANQADAILRYATRRDMDIVATYSDEGRSGLKADNRPGLQQLLADVQRGGCCYEIILVYDVSRWGRFQDADESAYYEYICRREGFAVHYCAEQFENDGSPVSAIVKGVKRAMAGEYSRELSAKVFTGHCRLVERGYWQGGSAAFGLRRLLVGEGGAVKGQLCRGEHKSLQTDRIIVVPGPRMEVDLVRRIYSLFVQEGKTEQTIARELNAEGLTTARRRPWSPGAIRRILQNETYIGNYVWNRCSTKLSRKRIHNGPEMFVRSDGAFEPIVDRAAFMAARAVLRNRQLRRDRSDNEVLECLRRLGAQTLYLSKLIVEEADNLPSVSSLQKRFGSLAHAFTLAGYPPSRDFSHIEINRRLRAVQDEIVALARAGIERVGGQVRHISGSDILAINDEFTASIAMCRCKKTQSGNLQWQGRRDTAVDMTILVRMDGSNRHILDYYILPRLEGASPRLLLAERNNTVLDSYRFDSLEPLFTLSARANVQEVADAAHRKFGDPTNCDRQNPCPEPAHSQPQDIA